MKSRTLTGSGLAVLAFMAVGSSVAAAEELTDYPIAGGQAARYAVAAVLLLVIVRGRLRRPSARELAQLTALSVTGLVLFNVLLLEAVRRADAGSVGVIVGAVPVVLVIVVPLLGGERIRPALLVAAFAVALGAALVQAAGGRMPADALLLSLGVLACEAASGCSPARSSPPSGLPACRRGSCCSRSPCSSPSGSPPTAPRHWRCRPPARRWRSPTWRPS